VPFGAMPTLAAFGLATILIGVAVRWRLHHHPEAMRSLVRALRS
jgi:hypothetical protein